MNLHKQKWIYTTYYNSQFPIYNSGNLPKEKKNNEAPKMT